MVWSLGYSDGVPTEWLGWCWLHEIGQDDWTLDSSKVVSTLISRLRVVAHECSEGSVLQLRAVNSARPRLAHV